MNTKPKSEGRLQIAREDCEVGDWVDVAAVPEWSAELSTHVFRREGISISPGDGGMGGLLPSQPEKWSFVSARRDSQPVWLRDR
ncbi:hypothetical protein OKA05_19405 [Luteolibacter arcticus]|uniref:Uncharacterized protein n=1 Tax=Luteolibacter arcticus TaxID=1581411 RepID=A0ABT3GMM0_9BACT|nr:hypothetical protein [Luteolibacter arcticus]MCW1924741.1 hypothetical protein [Luteolibacter arcticus]